MSDSIRESPVQVPSSSPTIQDVPLMDLTSVDESILHSALSKDQLRTVALHRLGEVRSQLVNAQKQLTKVQNELESTKQERMTLSKRWRDEVEAGRTQTSAYYDAVAELREQVSQLEEQRNNRNETSTTNPTNQPQPFPAQPPLQLSRGKTVEPDKFNGADKTQSIEDFLVTVERYLRLSRTEPAERVDTAVGFFSGVALKWWISVERTHGEKMRLIDWKDFRQMCLKRFVAVTDSESAVKKICRWKQSGSINSYIASFQNLSQQIPIDLLPEKTRLLYFLEGLTIDLQKYVNAMKPDSIEDAINFAQRIGNLGYTQGGTSFNNREYQQYNRNPRQPQQQTTSHSIGTRNHPIYLENVNSEVSEVDSSVGVSSPGPQVTVTSPTERTDRNDLFFLTVEQKKLLKEGRCFNCKQIGHRRSDCPRSCNQKKE